MTHSSLSASPPSETVRAQGTWGRVDWWPWGVGLFVGLVVLGPGLGAGSLLSLDLLVTPDIELPPAIFGLGPALSQRVPFFALIGFASDLVGGPLAVKVLIVASITSGFAGSARLVRLLSSSNDVVAQLGSGLLWAAGPFALTRIGVGHLNLVWAIGVLPWALPRLCRPSDHLPSTFLASLALAIAGPGGGALGLVVGGVGYLMNGRRRRSLTAVTVLAPHIVWVLPTVVLLWAGAGVSGASPFSTSAGGLRGWLALPGGGGFWRLDLQAGSSGWLLAFLGTCVAVTSFVATRRLIDENGFRSWQGAAAITALLGLVMAVASAAPGLRDVYELLAQTAIGAPLRESSRFLALWLVWAAPTAAIGAKSLADRSSSALPAVLLALIVLTSVPSWWGIDGTLEPVQYPRSWSDVRSRIAEAPGTVVALPWSEYPTISFANGRQVLNPLAQYLGGDVITSYDPRLDPAVRSQEQVDPRAVAVDDLVESLRTGSAPDSGVDPDFGSDLAKMGVRWVVLAHEENWMTYRAIESDPNLQLEFSGPGIDLYSVRDWIGPGVGPDGQSRTLERIWPPVYRTSGEKGTVLNMAGAPGWVQGFATPTDISPDGRLVLQGNSSLLWFWPAGILLVADLAVLTVAVWSLRRRKVEFGTFLALSGDRG